MIMIRSIVRPEKSDNALAALMEAGFPAVTKMSVVGRGKQRGIKIGDITYDEISKDLLLTVVNDQDKDFLIKTVIKNEAGGSNLNRIRGKIVNKTNNGNGLKATIDTGCMEFHAAIPRNIFDFEIHENVWVCFAPDAPHPLCGRRCREPYSRRKCLNEIVSGHSNSFVSHPSTVVPPYGAGRAHRGSEFLSPPKNHSLCDLREL